MQLIGMLDSPYVRRVAIGLQLLGLPFEHRPVSVFRHYAQFAAINPVVKAPTLVCDDGTVLMDSTLILDYAQSLAPARRLLPSAPAELAQALRSLGLALAACEKSVQIIYERQLRPASFQHVPWLERVGGQLQAAYAALEVHWAAQPPAASHTLDLAGVTVAVAWHFTQATLADVLPPLRCPALHAHSLAAEARPEFAAAAHGPGTVPTAG